MNGLEPLSSGPPFNWKVKGGVPLDTNTVMVPFEAVGQDVAVEVVVAFTPAKTETGTVSWLVEQPLPRSLTTMVWLPGERLLNVNGIVPGTAGPPSSEKVYGPTPEADVIVIVPLFTPEQEAGVVVVVAVMAGPVATISVKGAVAQLELRSVTTIVCAPAERLLNVNGIVPGTAGPPSIEKV